MEGRLRFVAAFLIIAAAMNLAVAQTTLTVGDTTGWTIPLQIDFYKTWASQQKFATGDVLEFKWSNLHTVANVTKEDYKSCSTRNTAGVINISPARITITARAGETQYFICTIGNHCKLGQNLAVTVGGGSGSPSTPSTPAAPPPSAAPVTTTVTAAVLVLGFSISLLSFIM